MKQWATPQQLSDLLCELIQIPILESQQGDGKMTGLAVVVEVEECFIHCPRAFKQGVLWNTEKWIPKEAQPNVTNMFKAHFHIFKSAC